LFQLLTEALNSPYLKCKGWSAVELMSGLSRLAFNDENSAAIMKYEILKLIRLMLTKGTTMLI